MAVKKILIVNDDKEILDLVGKKLVSLGYQVIKASLGKEAVLRAQTYRPDLILLDIMLPDIDGAEVLNQLKLDPKTEYIPILFLSGIVNAPHEPSNQVTVAGRQFEAIPKPFQFEDLHKKILELLK